MILYFSGTGNSGFIADELGKQLGEEVVKMTSCDPASLKFSGNTLGIVCPVYAWGVPPLVGGVISRLNDAFVAAAREKGVWGVLTCGDETGKAPDMLRKMLAKRDLTPTGLWSVIMPNVYLMLPGFTLDSKEVENKKIRNAGPQVRDIARAIGKGEYAEDCHEGPLAWIKTKAVYPLFEKMGVVASKWNVSDTCISCGRCERNCPVGNIRIKDGRPRWADKCVSCMACYHGCPTNAINYGKITQGRGQYRRFLK